MPTLGLPSQRIVLTSHGTRDVFDVTPDVVPQFWADEAFDKRYLIEAHNNTGYTLHDYIITTTIPLGATIDADSLRVFEIGSTGVVEQAHEYRYAQTQGLNRIWWKPCYLAGNTLTIKALGRWQQSEHRYFGVYWDSTSTVGPNDYDTHLSGTSRPWTVTVAAGGAGNVYRLNMGGEIHFYVQGAGDTASVIVNELEARIDSGLVATSSDVGNVLTIIQNDPMDISFEVTNTGSTFPANLVIARPIAFGLGRIGPDNDFNYGQSNFGLPTRVSGSDTNTRPSFGINTNHAPLRLGTYSVNGVGLQVPSVCSLLEVVSNGPKLVGGGLVTHSRSEWSCEYSVEYRHIYYSGRKSDNTNAGNVIKYVNAMRFSILYQCTAAYTPTAVSASTTTLGSHELVSLATSQDTFSGNTTTAVASRIPNFYADAATGTITAYDNTSGAALAGLDVPTTIMGTAGNAQAAALWVDEVVISNFGTQTPNAKWTTATNRDATLQLRNLSSATQIPFGATVELNGWVVAGNNPSSTTTGDNLLPDEVIDIIRSLASSPAISVGTVDTFDSDSLDASLLTASDQCVAGIQWFQDHAVQYTGKAGNGAYSIRVDGTSVDRALDDDGSYGESYKLAGLCLRYLRTHEASLIPIIEQHVQYFLMIEADAVALYGSFWSGSIPYWYWPKTTPSQSDPLWTFPPNDGNQDGTNPNNNYVQGQPRRRTSIDQTQIASIGFYHYLYLLRNEAAITANTALWAAAKAYIGRMATFQTANYSAGYISVPNLNRIVNGLAPTTNNGVDDDEMNTFLNSTLPNPYWGMDPAFNDWQVENADGYGIYTSSNQAHDDFFRALYAPDTTVTGLERLMKGFANDMAGANAYHHDLVFTTHPEWNINFNSTTFPPYPSGWSLLPYRSGPAPAGENRFRYQAGRTGDDHYLQVELSGYRDAMYGRAAQRLAVLCFVAMMDPTYEIPVEMNLTTPLRTIPILDEIDNVARSLMLYCVNPNTNAVKVTASGWLGNATSLNNPYRIDSAVTGYWMMAVELVLAVKNGAVLADYYPAGSF